MMFLHFKGSLLSYEDEEMNMEESAMVDEFEKRNFESEAV